MKEEEEVKEEEEKRRKRRRKRRRRRKKKEPVMNGICINNCLYTVAYNVHVECIVQLKGSVQ